MRTGGVPERYLESRTTQNCRGFGNIKNVKKVSSVLGIFIKLRVSSRNF
jgi:hypothetical protein